MNAATLPMLVGLAGSLAVLCLCLGVYRLLRPAGELEGRLGESVNRTPAGPAEPPFAALVRSLTHISVDRKLADKIAIELVQADMAMSVNEFVLIRVGGALLACLFGALILGNILFGLALAVIALQAPVFIVHSRCKQRQQRFQNQLVDVITMLTSGLRAGVGLMQAMDLVRREMPAPAGDEFERVVREVGLGAGLDDALDHLLERMPGDDLGMLVTVVKIQAEVGGNLVSILETVLTTIRDRVRIAQEIRTLTAQGRMTGYLVGGLPFIIGGAFMLINPQYMGGLFKPQWIWLPAAAVVMIGIGFVIINRIVNIKV